MSNDSLPTFLINHLHTIALKEGFEEGYDVKHNLGSKLDEGFMAELLSITIVGNRRKESSVDLQTDELSLVCKLQPRAAAFRESFGSELVFQSEVFMYNTILPALVKFQKDHGVTKEYSFTCFPKCHVAFHEVGNSESVIIMDDLRAAGYEIWKKKIPTNFESTRLLMEQLGRFHGLSIVIRKQNPELFKEFQQLPLTFVSLFSSPGIASMLQSTFEYAISLIDNPEDVVTLGRLGKDLRQTYLDGLDLELLGDYGVVSHGDCWINNMMFKLNEVGLISNIYLLSFIQSYF